jgi:hypothetical protein
MDIALNGFKSVQRGGAECTELTSPKKLRVLRASALNAVRCSLFAGIPF